MTTTLTPEIKQWLAFAKQKIEEVTLLKSFASNEQEAETSLRFIENTVANENRKTSKLIHNPAVKNRVSSITAKDSKRENTFAIRRKKQIDVLNLPLFPTTTIGSFPQTTEVRSWRAKFKKGELNSRTIQ